MTEYRIVPVRGFKWQVQERDHEGAPWIFTAEYDGLYQSHPTFTNVIEAQNFILSQIRDAEHVKTAPRVYP